MTELILLGAQGRLGSEVLSLWGEEHVQPLLRTSWPSKEKLREFLLQFQASRPVLLDVSHSLATKQLVSFLLELETLPLAGLVIGTTGHDLQAELEQLAQRYPICVRPNFSQGVFLLQQILQAQTPSGLSVQDLARQ